MFRKQTKNKKKHNQQKTQTDPNNTTCFCPIFEQLNQIIPISIQRQMLVGWYKLSSQRKINNNFSYFNRICFCPGCQTASQHFHSNYFPSSPFKSKRFLIQNNPVTEGRQVAIQFGPFHRCSIDALTKGLVFDHGIKLIEFSPFSVSIRHTRNNKIPGWFLAQFDWLFQRCQEVCGTDVWPTWASLFPASFPEEDQNNPFPKPQTMASPRRTYGNRPVWATRVHILAFPCKYLSVCTCLSGLAQLKCVKSAYLFSSRDSSVGKGDRQLNTIKRLSVRISIKKIFFFFITIFFLQCNSDILICFPASLRLFHYRSRRRFLRLWTQSVSTVGRQAQYSMRF